MESVKYHMWRTFPSEHLKIFLEATELAWNDSHKWDNKDLQQNIEKRLSASYPHGSLLHSNVPLYQLGVSKSKCEIDIVVRGDLENSQTGLFMIQLSGHQAPRHEKEILEFMAVSLVNSSPCFGVFVVCTDNHLNLEGKANSFNYCGRRLLSLAEGCLEAARLRGLLIIGLPTPERMSEDQANED